MYVSQPKIIHKPLLSSYTDTGRCYEKNKNNRSDPIGSHCSGSYELCIFLFSFALPLCHDSFCFREVVCIHKCLLRNDRPAVPGQRLKKTASGCKSVCSLYFIVKPISSMILRAFITSSCVPFTITALRGRSTVYRIDVSANAWSIFAAQCSHAISSIKITVCMFHHLAVSTIHYSTLWT